MGEGYQVSILSQERDLFLSPVEYTLWECEPGSSVWGGYLGTSTPARILSLSKTPATKPRFISIYKMICGHGAGSKTMSKDILFDGKCLIPKRNDGGKMSCTI